MLVNISEIDPRLYHGHGLKVGLQNSSVNLCLFLGEFSIDWEAAGDISAVSIGNAPHIVKDDLSISGLGIVNNVVKGSAIFASSANALVGKLGCALEAAVQLEELPELELTHTRLGVLHDILVGLAGDPNRLSHELNLEVSFDAPALADGLEEVPVVHARG